MVEINLNRRQFLKLSGATAATLAVVELGFNENEVQAKTKEFKIAKATVTPTICPYCAVGCGILVHTKNNDVVYTEGDPDHPINEGSLCSKGTTISFIIALPQTGRRLWVARRMMPKMPGNNMRPNKMVKKNGEQSKSF